MTSNPRPFLVRFGVPAVWFAAVTMLAADADRGAGPALLASAVAGVAAILVIESLVLPRWRARPPHIQAVLTVAVYWAASFAVVALLLLRAGLRAR